MNIEETKTYLILRYGSMYNAHKHWQTNNCFSQYDNDIITKLVSFYLNERVGKVDKQG